ncbi:MAG: hypothetical protein JO308_11470 [Verrucomicrobia bacterium]|nr:hypothetical protein [Verrucomicrobiota bacterium]
MDGCISRVRVVFVVFALTEASTFFVRAADQRSLHNDPDYREEQGVNQYTVPPIQTVLASLDSLQPIPIDQVRRPITKMDSPDRPQLALGFGVLIGDGFLAVISQNATEFESIGRELIRRAEGLGVGSEVTRHSRKILQLAKGGDWTKLRTELIVTQNDVEDAMLQLRDEQLVHLLSLGGWIRGLQIAAASVQADFTPERVAKLQQTETLDYYLDRLDTLSPRLKKSPLIAQITSTLKAVRTDLASTTGPTRDQVASIADSTRALVDQIEK